MADKLKSLQSITKHLTADQILKWTAKVKVQTAQTVNTRKVPFILTVVA